jgi:hypothetical protein
MIINRQTLDLAFKGFKTVYSDAALGQRRPSSTRSR